jgi:hypothetical protein
MSIIFIFAAESDHQLGRAGTLLDRRRSRPRSYCLKGSSSVRATNVIHPSGEAVPNVRDFGQSAVAAETPFDTPMANKQAANTKPKNLEFGLQAW